MLSLAWLAVQLEWRPVRAPPGTDRAQIEFMDKKGTPVEAELLLVPQINEMAQGLQKVTIAVQAAVKGQEFVVEREPRQHLMILSSQSEKAIVELRKAPHTDSSMADLLHRELGRRVRNRVFERSFAMATKLLQMI